MFWDSNPKLISKLSAIFLGNELINLLEYNAMFDTKNFQSINSFSGLSI